MGVVSNRSDYDRGRLIDMATRLHKLICERKRISLCEIAEELGAGSRTARRWVEAYSLVHAVRIERGVVIRDENPRQS